MSKSAKDQPAWTSIQFKTGLGQEDLACWLMIEWGAYGCETQACGDQQVIIKAAFESTNLSDSAIKDLALVLEGYGLGESLRTLRVEQVNHEDWLSKWKEGFGPFPVGNRLLICPAWRAASEKGRTPLVINPGMAFGTGLHATTQYCLQAIERLASPGKILDVGTGSGILAIASALLHPNAGIVALDNNTHAIENARENIRLNNLSDRIQLIEGEPGASLGKFDCILSNLTYEDIIALLPVYLNLLEVPGKIICSGILEEKLGNLESALSDRLLRIIDKSSVGEWVGLTISMSTPG
jgi:ribosomal protein L11 methyltransferase